MIKRLDFQQLTIKANEIIKDLLNICIKNGAGHIAPSLSCLDILVSLYYYIMNITDDSKYEDRDRLVFSKGHGVYALYAILNDIGYIKRKDWENFYQGGFLHGCIERSIEHGIEASCGSLGHGLPMAVGMAFGAKIQNKNFRTYCIVGDGEMQEGSNWEAIQFAVKQELSNLTVIVDNNKLQAMDFLENILTLKGRKNDLKVKFNAFGFKVNICDGHNMRNIINSLEKLIKIQDNSTMPQVLIAHTIKGYGLKCMENTPEFHFRLPTVEEVNLGGRFE